MSPSFLSSHTYKDLTLNSVQELIFCTSCQADSASAKTFSGQSYLRPWVFHAPEMMQGSTLLLNFNVAL